MLLKAPALHETQAVFMSVGGGDNDSGSDCYHQRRGKSLVGTSIMALSRTSQWYKPWRQPQLKSTATFKTEALAWRKADHMAGVMGGSGRVQK